MIETLEGHIFLFICFTYWN